MVFVNHLRETLTPVLSNDYLLEQLQTFKANGNEFIILPQQWEYKQSGFLSSTTFTHEEWLVRKKMEWEDMMTNRGEDEEYLTFENWLEDDIDDLYCSIDDLIEQILEEDYN